MPDAGSGTRGGWLRALGLMGATGAFSVFNPGVLVALPFGLLALLQPPRGFLTLALGAMAVGLAIGGTPDSGLWYLERGWGLLLGGWFLALTLRWPEGRFFPRGLGAVAGTFGAMGLLFWTRPGDWAVMDWAVTARMEAGMSLALEAARITLGPEAVSVAFEARILEAMALQGLIFPALLGLASLSGLGLAWWLHQRLARAGGESIGPLREFRFNDQLVWVLIAGLMVLLGSSGLPGRIGTNAVVFFGALYALRGVAVVLFVSGGVSFLGGVLFLLGFLLVAPLVISGAFIIGLGDTWLDLRARAKTKTPS